MNSTAGNVPMRKQVPTRAMSSMNLAELQRNSGYSGDIQLPGAIPAMVINQGDQVEWKTDKSDDRCISTTNLPQFENDSSFLKAIDKTGVDMIPPPNASRRASLMDRPRKSSLKDNLKNLWSRRSSLTLFKSNNKLDAGQDGQEGAESDRSDSTIDELMREDGMFPSFFLVDKSLIKKEPTKRRKSLNFFRM